MDEYSRWPLWILLCLPISVGLFFIRPDNDWVRMIIRFISLTIFLRFVFTFVSCSEIFKDMFGYAIGVIVELLGFAFFAVSIVFFIMSWTSGNNIIGISGNMSAAKKTDLVVTSSILFGIIIACYILSLIFAEAITDHWSYPESEIYSFVLGPWLVIGGLIMNALEITPDRGRIV